MPQFRWQPHFAPPSSVAVVPDPLPGPDPHRIVIINFPWQPIVMSIQIILVALPRHAPMMLPLFHAWAIRQDVERHFHFTL